MRLFELPLALCPNGTPALAVLAERTSGLAVAWRAYLGEGLGGDAPTVYSMLGAGGQFAQIGTLRTAYPDTTETIDVKLGCVIQLSGVDTGLDEQSLFGALGNKFLAIVGDEILSVAGWTLVSTNTYRLYFVRGRFDTPRQSHASGDEIYLITAAGLVALQAPSFQPGNTAYLKLLTGAPNRAGDLSDVDPITLVFAGVMQTAPAVGMLRVNGVDRNAMYHIVDPVDITWDLPVVTSEYLRAYTLLEFLEAGVVVHTIQVPFPANTELFSYPAPQPATFVVRASAVVETDWNVLTGPSVEVGVTRISEGS